MAKITSRAQLNVGTELTVDETARTITLNVAGNLVAKDGVTWQALYSKLVELWATAAYQDSPFPVYAIDARSGQFQIGTDGARFNNWRFADDATRSYMRDGGWSEYTPTTPGSDGTSAAGTLAREYVGIVALASGFPAGAQFYYQRAVGGAPINFTYNDAPNEGIQVFGDATNGNFDSRAFFKIFCREYNYTYDDAVLSDVGETGTGAFKVSLPVSVNAETGKVTANDATVAANAPYNGITVEFFASDQNRTIGGTAYPFRKIIQGNGGTLEQIYTKMQYLLRQAGDIDSGAGSVTGKTADQLCYFEGDTLYTTQGVYIDNVLPADSNRVVFVDQNGVQRTNPFTAAGTLSFNAALVGAGSSYRLFFASLPGAGNDWGENGAVTVNNAAGTPITGTISSATIAFDFDYDGNVQGGRIAGTDAAVELICIRPGTGKYVRVSATLTRSKAISISAVAEQDRAYV
jgi:hypothetical protein